MISTNGERNRGRVVQEMTRVRESEILDKEAREVLTIR